MKKILAYIVLLFWAILFFPLTIAAAGGLGLIWALDTVWGRD